MDRKEAEKIVRRDLPGVIKEMLKGLPARPAGLVQQVYDSSFEAMVTNLVDGKIQLAPDGRLTTQLVESSGTFTLKLSDSAGNTTSFPNT